VYTQAVGKAYTAQTIPHFQNSNFTEKLPRTKTKPMFCYDVYLGTDWDEAARGKFSQPNGRAVWVASAPWQRTPRYVPSPPTCKSLSQTEETTTACVNTAGTSETRQPVCITAEKRIGE
jgi:hypothetical protein